MKPTLKIQGLRELDAGLAEFSKATARNVLQRALLKGCDPILEEARRLAPEARGVLKRKIRKSTKKPTGHSTKVAFAAGKAAGLSDTEAGELQKAYNRANPSTFAEAFVGVEPRVAQAWPQEIGTAHHAPQPYMRPAFDAKKEEALAVIVREIKPEIDRAADRARRRAAKRALKG